MRGELKTAAVGAVVVLTAVAAHGQEAPVIAAPGPIEEVVVVGRQLSAATNVVAERMDKAVAADFLDAEQIGRVGDSDVAAALRRIPGVTLVQGKFVYVRGLGERYSSSLLNSATVPSPDLTRNVLPLDIFPTSVVDSLVVQKAYSPDLPAAFGGGNIDVRTRGIPDGFLADLQVGTGFNSDSKGSGLKYPGGDDDRFGTDDGTRRLPNELAAAIQEFQGRIGASDILAQLRQRGENVTFADAAAINRDLAASLNRNIDFSSSDLDPDLSAEGSLGNRWYLPHEFEAGFIATGSYDRGWRNIDRTVRSANNPTTEFIETQRTLDQVTMAGTLSGGVRWSDDHHVEASRMYFRNTEDEAALSVAATFNFQPEAGRQLRNYKLRFEERELDVKQYRGTHTLGDATAELLDRFGLGVLAVDALEGLTFSWYFSDSMAKTDIPNEVLISAEDEVDPATGALLSTRMRRTSSVGDYRFTDLDDDVEGSGWVLSLPFVYKDFIGDVSGGQDYTRKGRMYRQYQFFLGTTSASNEALAGTPGQALADDRLLDPANGWGVESGGIGTESYLAGQIVDAAFGKLDVTWRDTLRFSGGVRWEQFSQASVPFDPLQFDPAIGQVSLTPEELLDYVFLEDEYYPAIATTWIVNDFWAETFQLRFGWGKTVARPDLREISQATYIDPLTEARVTGNPKLSTSDLTNYDLRAEWFFESGDNFTVSVFYKDIADPIETVQEAASDNDLALSFTNGESGELYGVEVEWLKRLSFLSGWLGGWTEAFYVSGNVTWSDSEVDVSNVIGLTSPKRELAQQSEWVANVQLGYDSFDNKHSATVAYNFFDERIFFAGRNGAPDFYEQPFHSLDLTYSWYPLDPLSVKLKAQNLLDEKVELDAGGVTVLEQTVGRSFSLDLKWSW